MFTCAALFGRCSSRSSEAKPSESVHVLSDSIMYIIYIYKYIYIYIHTHK